MRAAMDVQAAENEAENGPSTSQAGSPEPGRPKKSYFDDIPTSSPGGGLSRDAEMTEDGEMNDVDDALFGPGSQAALQSAGDVFAFTRADPSGIRQRAATLGMKSEADFNDADIQGFDLDDGPDDFDMDAEAELAMREMETMENAGESDMVRAAKAREARRAAATATQKEHRPISFYGDAVAKQKAAMPKKPSVVEADNFDDFDFGDEEDMLRDMQRAEAEAERRMQAEASRTEQPKAADLSKTPSLSTGTDSFDLEDELELDEDFLKGVEEAEKLDASQKAPESVAPSQSSSKMIDAVITGLVFDEEEDLYS